MNKLMKSFALVMVLLALSVIPALAQTNTVATTISAAITAGQNTTTISITSTTGMTASTNSAQTYILVDKELMRIVSLSPFVVSRGEMGSQVSGHVSGSYAFYGTVGSWSNISGKGSGVFLAGSGAGPVGSCTRTDFQFLPMFTVSASGTPRIFDCNGGSIVNDTLPITVTQSAARTACTYKLANGGAIPGDLVTYGTDATRVSGTIYIGNVDIPKTQLVTGLSNLTGTTAPTTDKQLFAIYDNGGKLVASTAVAGVAAATADIFFDQNIALVNGAASTQVFLLPGRYWFALQLNGTTTTIQMIATAGGYSASMGNSRTGTFGTLPAITIPTAAITTSASPIMCSF